MSVHSSTDVSDVLRPVAELVVHPEELPDSDRLDVRSAAREGAAHVVGMARRRPGSFSLALLGSAVFIAGVLATATVVGDLTDELLVPVLDGGEPVGPRLRSALLALLGVGVWRAAGITLRRSYAGITQVGVLADLRRALVRHQLDLSLTWYAGQRVGDLLAVNESHARRSTMLLGPLPFTTGAVLLVAGTIVQAFRLDIALGALITVTMLAVITGQLVASWLAMRLFVVEQHRRTVVARVAHESVDGAQTVRALGRRAGEVARVGARVSDLRDAEVAVSRRFAWLRAAIETVPSIVAVPVLVLGSIRVGTGELTPGELVGLVYLLSLLSFPLAGLGFLLWDVTESLTAWRRVATVLRADDLAPVGTDTTVGDGAGALRAAEVTFSYVGEQPPTLDVDLDLPSGRMIAVVGPTGAGKTTLLELLAGLWEPTAGRVELDGQDVLGLTPSARAARVALVRQEAFLFADTLRGNVDMGRGLDEGRVRAALDAAGAGDVIAELPDGLDSVLGERGVTLSGGQRQRVALARALAGRPSVLLLDDATSAVDPTVEQGVLDGLAAATGGATVILVGSRPATIARCDSVVLLEAGRVVAAGQHEELLRQEPAYRRLLDAYEHDRRDRTEGGS